MDSGAKAKAASRQEDLVRGSASLYGASGQDRRTKSCTRARAVATGLLWEGNLYTRARTASGRILPLRGGGHRIAAHRVVECPLPPRHMERNET